MNSIVPNVTDQHLRIIGFGRQQTPESGFHAAIWSECPAKVKAAKKG